jgi:hypothetical protein
MEELRRRNVVRSSNNPLGDYTEWLVAHALQLDLCAASKSGFDALASDGVRFQIKGRRRTPSNPSVQLGALRGLAFRPFDVLAAVVFTEHFIVDYAAKVPIEVVIEQSKFQKHTNSYLLMFRQILLADPRVTDISADLRAAQNV